MSHTPSGQLPITFSATRKASRVFAYPSAPHKCHESMGVEDLGDVAGSLCAPNKRGQLCRQIVGRGGGFEYTISPADDVGAASLALGILAVSSRASGGDFQARPVMRVETEGLS